jgi:copper chaperone CopZ
MASVRLTFHIEGMHCASCTLLIDEALEELVGVRRSTTKLRKRRTVVDIDPAICAPDDIVVTIADVGYVARIKS